MRKRHLVTDYVTIEKGVVPCQTCGKPHNLLKLTNGGGTWADPNDDHAYRPMRAEQVAEAWRRGDEYPG